MKKFLKAKRKILNRYVRRLERKYHESEYWRAYGEEVWAEFCVEYERLKRRVTRIYRDLENKIPESALRIRGLQGRLEHYLAYSPS